MTNKENILVTGGLGFIGSHTVLCLHEAGYCPIIIDNLHNSRMEVLDALTELLGFRPAFIEGDVNDRQLLDSLFLQYQFDALLDLLDMKNSPQGEPRTIYSLRHSSIMFRLLYGASIDTLKLARNARTSPEMIDRFYAAPLMGEMAIQELQAKRRPRPWER